MPVSDPKVAILLATRNGAEFLQQQLDSFRAQTFSNWELFVSDDCSTDETRELLAGFAGTVPQRVVIMDGPQLGFWQNFVSLVRHEGSDAELFAYSDQDDIWFPDKLNRAVAWFATRTTPEPALYFTRTELIRRDGSPMGFSPLFTREPSFRNALVQNIGGGNTMVFNRPARAALLSTPADADMVSHDWWTYQVITGVGGIAHYDPWPSLQYRQHGQNIVGANIGLEARMVRLSAFAGGRVVRWNGVNFGLLTRMRAMLTPDNAATLDCYMSARNAPAFLRLWRVVQSGVYRQGRLEQVGLLIGALLGKL